LLGFFLGEAVLKFRQALQNPSSDVKTVQAARQQLYTWLIQPIAKELQANQVKNLAFSLDRVTRYIPIRALFDGQKYLIENYAVSTMLSAGLTRMGDRLPADPQTTPVLALGASQFQDFSPLPNVPAEVDAIVRQPDRDPTGIYPGLTFLDQAFDFRALRDHLPGHKVLHIATHASFVPGRPEDSFLVLGNCAVAELKASARFRAIANPPTWHSPYKTSLSKFLLAPDPQIRARQFQIRWRLAETAAPCLRDWHRARSLLPLPVHSAIHRRQLRAASARSPEFR
jgi:CHAT domain-containing protein